MEHKGEWWKLESMSLSDYRQRRLGVRPGYLFGLLGLARDLSSFPRLAHAWREGAVVRSKSCKGRGIDIGSLDSLDERLHSERLERQPAENDGLKRYSRSTERWQKVALSLRLGEEIHASIMDFRTTNVSNQV